MSTDNPVSPKVIAGGIGAAVLPIVAGAVITIVDTLTASNIFAGLTPQWQYLVTILLSVVGAVAAGYRKTDPLRVPTVQQDALDEINE